MKYVIVLADGMADEPIEKLGGRTPMEAADKPMMNFFAQKGINGLVDTVPEGMTPESDTANLAVMGYDPKKYSKGRSPLEAASMGIEMGPDDTAIRANIVTLSESGEDYDDKIMIDHSADEISTEEARELILAVNEKLKTEDINFYPGVSYRHCLIYRNCPEFKDYTRPHDILGKCIRDYLPRSAESEPFLRMQRESFDILTNHPVNLARAARGLKKANSLWFWGPGKKPSIPDFYETYGLKATVISAVDLIKGIGICAGMKSVDVEGATGTLETNYEGKMQAALNALETGSDYVYIHVEGPDECGHRGELENKIKSIENIDKRIIAPLYKEMCKKYDDFKIMVLPDHPTPIRLRTHTHAPVPFVIYQKSAEKDSGVDIMCEKNAKGRIFIPHGDELINLFLK